MTAKRKTIAIDDLIDHVNEVLSLKGGDQQVRLAAAEVLEFALHKVNRYQGYRYLTQSELHSDDVPGLVIMDWGTVVLDHSR